ncbi:MAG: preprotein translocase subunit SecA, partial [Bacteroidetes bacterium]
MFKFLSKLFPSKSEKDVQRIEPLVDEINEHFEKLKSLSDDELRGKTIEFRQRIKEAISEFEEEIVALREQLKTNDKLTLQEREEIFEQISENHKKLDETTKETLDELLPEAYAVVKDACRRLVGKTFDLLGHKIVWDMVPFDVQLMGAVVLHEGKIAEMATGEGKTLVATMPLYLNALPGRGVHLVTVNDYLAKRDSEWMGKIFEFLG